MRTPYLTSCVFLGIVGESFQWKPKAVCGSCLTDSSELVGHLALDEPEGIHISALGK